jgi:transcriptional regulator with XRE-family HTH domain
MKTQYEILTEDPEFRKLLAIETLMLEATGVVAGLMAEQGVTKADLARRLNKSRAWITQLLSGKANMTIRTLAEVVHALGAEVNLHGQRPAPVRNRHYVLDQTPASPSSLRPEPAVLPPVKPGYAA